MDRTNSALLIKNVTQWLVILNSSDQYQAFWGKQACIYLVCTWCVLWVGHQAARCCAKRGTKLNFHTYIFIECPKRMGGAKLLPLETHVVLPRTGAVKEKLPRAFSSLGRAEITWGLIPCSQRLGVRTTLDSISNDIMCIKNCKNENSWCVERWWEAPLLLGFPKVSETSFGVVTLIVIKEGLRRQLVL